MKRLRFDRAVDDAVFVVLLARLNTWGVREFTKTVRIDMRRIESVERFASRISS